MPELLLSILSKLGLQELLLLPLLQLLSLLLLPKEALSILSLLSLVVAVPLLVRIQFSEAAVEHPNLIMEESLEMGVGLVGVDDGNQEVDDLHDEERPHQRRGILVLHDGLVALPVHAGEQQVEVAHYEVNQDAAEVQSRVRGVNHPQVYQLEDTCKASIQ